MGSFYQLGRRSEKENPETAKQNYQKALDILKILGTAEEPADYLKPDILESWSKLLKGAEAESMKVQALDAREKQRKLEEEQKVLVDEKSEIPAETKPKRREDDD